MDKAEPSHTPQTRRRASQPGSGRQRIDGAAAERHLGSWVPSSQGCWRSVTMATLNELNLVTDPYLFLICGPFGTKAGNQLENNPVTYQKENYLYLFIQVELASLSDASRPAPKHITQLSRTPSLTPQDLCPSQPTKPCTPMSHQHTAHTSPGTATWPWPLRGNHAPAPTPPQQP